jgi:hypothetical protein
MNQFVLLEFQTENAASSEPMGEHISHENLFLLFLSTPSVSVV